MKHIFSIVLFATLALGVVASTANLTYAQLGGGDRETRLGGQSAETQEGGECQGVCIRNPIAADNIQELFKAIIDIVLVFAIPLIVLAIIYAGFLYVTARGNEATIQKAHMALLYAIIGGLLILGARVLIEVVAGTVESITK